VSNGAAGVPQKNGPSLFNSDVYTSYTAWYSWTSNQAAHMGLGCAVATIAMGLLPWFDQHRWAMFLVYPWKEALDFYLAWRVNKPPFAMRPFAILADCLTDLGFVSLGVLIVALSPIGWSDLIPIAAMLGVLLAVAMLYWKAGKKAYDKSGLPFLFRLATFHPAVWTTAEAPIRNFLEHQGIEHLVLFGSYHSGKTSLAAGIGCEALEKGALVRYLAAGRLIEELGSPASAPSAADQVLTVAEANLLIVDDVMGLAALAPLANGLKGKRCVWGVTSLANVNDVVAAIQTALPGATLVTIDVGKMGYAP
jgi:hypothetical protein